MKWTHITALFASAIFMAGCGNGAPSSPPPQASNETQEPAAHSHAESGPHGGEIVDLGKGEYHAELVLDADAKTVTVHILDATAQAPAAIQATELTVNLDHDGQAEQFKLAAANQDEAPEAGSRFASSDEQLFDDLADGHAHGELAITIEGKQYRGELPHQH